MASVIGKPCGSGVISDTSVGIIPPSAKPTFHDRPVPVARNAVGNRSLRKISRGP